MTAKPRKTSELKSQRKQDESGTTIMICFLCRKNWDNLSGLEGMRRGKKGRMSTSIHSLNILSACNMSGIENLVSVGT